MKILIFLFAMITFILMASDPRRENFATRNTDPKKQDSKENDAEDYRLKKDPQDNADESS